MISDFRSRLRGSGKRTMANLIAPEKEISSRNFLTGDLAAVSPPQYDVPVPE